MATIMIFHTERSIYQCHSSSSYHNFAIPTTIIVYQYNYHYYITDTIITITIIDILIIVSIIVIIKTITYLLLVLSLSSLSLLWSWRWWNKCIQHLLCTKHSTKLSLMRFKKREKRICYSTILCPRHPVQYVFALRGYCVGFLSI